MFDFIFIDNLQFDLQFFQKSWGSKYVYNKIVETICSQKVVMGIDIDNIGDLEDLLKLVFISEKCGNQALTN